MSPETEGPLDPELRPIGSGEARAGARRLLGTPRAISTGSPHPERMMSASRAPEAARSASIPADHTPAHDAQTCAVRPGRRELRGLTHTAQRRALSPPERLQAASRAQVQRQAPITAGYTAPRPLDREALLLAGTEALSRVSQSLLAAREIFEKGGRLGLSKSIAAYGARLGLLGKHLPRLGDLATVVCALVEAANALDRGDLRRATDVLGSAALNTILGRHPFTAVPAAALTVTLGSDWPAKLIHHIAGTDEPEVIAGARYLRSR